MSKRQQQAPFPNASLCSSNVQLKSYTREQVKVAGEMAVSVVYNNSDQTSLSLSIISQDGPTLLGRNWLPTLFWTGNLSLQSTPREIHLITSSTLSSLTSLISSAISSVSS